MSPADEAALTAIVSEAGLDTGELPVRLRHRLDRAVEGAEVVLRQLLDRR
ncbi:hypothetical protein Q5762_35755 [Streptomyces sp. P9(2023)]|nr:hypothetical protein [Streptomyces sp. P9(2023)]MDT9693584.1 hypothetical protein [Streptomyces sp. P9(2023)]